MVVSIRRCCLWTLFCLGAGLFFSVYSYGGIGALGSTAHASSLSNAAEPVFHDDFSSYPVGAFPAEKWVTGSAERRLVRVAGLSSPVGLQVSAETSLVVVKPKVGARDSFLVEWRAYEMHGRYLCVAVRDSASGAAWGVGLSPLGVESFLVACGADPFKDRTVLVRVSSPARSLSAEHDYLLSVQDRGFELFCDGESIFAHDDDRFSGGIPELVAVQGTLPVVKRFRIWQWDASTLRQRIRQHKADAPTRRVCAKGDLKSPLFPSKTGELEPVEEARPFDTVFPRSPAPVASLHVVRADEIMRQHGAGLLLTLTSLQGLVNRTQPCIYLQIDPNDPWPQWLKERGDVTELTEVSDPVRLLEQFTEYADGSVVVDQRVGATINVATAIASVENLVLVHPDFASQIPWEVRHDLRGRWSCNAEAYRWAHETYWHRMNHHILACCYPLQMYAPRDYMIAFKIFPFYVSGRAGGKMPEADPKEELEFAEGVLSNTPVNIPIIGWESESTGIGELDAVRLFSWYGKFLVACNHSLNLSLHSGTRRGAYDQPPPQGARQLDQSKVYICFTMSDGDNLNTWDEFFRRYFNDPARGTIPIGWTLGLGAHDLIPDVMDWYYGNLSSADRFIGAFGVGYIYPDQFGRAYRNREPIYRQFIELSGEYLQHMNQDVVWLIFDPANDSSPGQLSRVNALVAHYAEQLPWLKAILTDYGYKPYGYDYGTAQFATKAGVPVFHAIAPSRAWRATPEDIIRDLRQRIGNRRPAFAHVFAFNWRITPTVIKNIAQELGDEFVPVRPDELGTLYLSWRRSAPEDREEGGRTDR